MAAPEFFVVWRADTLAVDEARPFEVWQVCSDDALSVVFQTRQGRSDVGCRFDWMCSCRRVAEGALKMRCGSFASFPQALSHCDDLNKPHLEAVLFARRARLVVQVDLDRRRLPRPECLANPDSLPLSAALLDGEVPF